MAQQFEGNQASKPLSPIKVGKKIRPQDPVTVYATEKTGSSKFNNYKTGDAMEVHSVLAEKLIEQGKATKEAPKTKKAD